MTGVATGSEEAARVRFRRPRRTDLHRRAFGIADPCIVAAAGVFDASGKVDGFLGRDVPRMPQVEIGEVLRHQVRVGEAVGWVFFGVAGNRAGLLDGLLDRIRGEVGGAGRSLAMAEIDRNGKATIAIAGDRLYFAKAHVYVKTGIDGRRNIGIAGAARADSLEHILANAGEAFVLGSARLSERRIDGLQVGRRGSSHFAMLFQ